MIKHLIALTVVQKWTRKYKIKFILLMKGFVLMNTKIKRSIITDFNLLKIYRIRLVNYDDKTEEIIVKDLDFNPYETKLINYICCTLNPHTFLYIPNNESLELLYSFMDESDCNRCFKVGLNYIERECFYTLEHTIKENETTTKLYLDNVQKLKELRTNILDKVNLNKGVN